MSGRGNGPGACVASPALGAGPAGAVGGGLKDAQGDQSLASWGRCARLAVSVGVGPGIGKAPVTHGALYQVHAFRICVPVNVNGKAMASVSFIILVEIFPVFAGRHSAGKYFLSCIFVCNGY